jgi:uncharacterized protein YdiU (UPF0061 family)
MAEVANRLNLYNPQIYLVRPLIESVWQSITEADNWQPFTELVNLLNT